MALPSDQQCDGRRPLNPSARQIHKHRALQLVDQGYALVFETSNCINIQITFDHQMLIVADTQQTQLRHLRTNY